MKVWTYGEMEQKVLDDLDLNDETFIKPNEMRGYFNEAITEAAAEIYVLNQDYFLTKFYIPFVQGTSRYSLPANIFANRIRTVMYSNGAVIYEIAQYRRKNKFEAMIITDKFGPSDDYMYTLWNDVPGQAVMAIHPNVRETAILAPIGSLFAPAIMFYLRDNNRVPLTGEFCNPEICATTQVNVGTDQIQTFSGTLTQGIPQQGLPGSSPGSIAYKTGDQIQFIPGPNGTLPSPLVQGTTYFAIANGSGLIKVATTLQNALAAVAIDLTTVGTIYFTIQVAATDAIIAATIMDIPEFATFVMQWVKCRCLEKEGDPRLVGAVNTLQQQRDQMVSTLVKGIDDDNDTIQADYSFYNDFAAWNGFSN